MRNLIKKILKEDFEWMNDEPMDLPIEEIKEWCYENMSKVSKYTQKIEETTPKLPQIQWGNLSHMRDKERMATESIKYIGYNLRNIYDSMEEIINNLENPEE